MRTGSRRFGVVLVALLVTIAGISACGDDDDTGSGDGSATTAPDADTVSVPIVTVTATESDDDGATGYAFEIDAEVPSGPTQINLRNDGAEPHHVQIYRLHDDTTMDEFGETLAGGDVGALLAIGAFVGGTGTADPGSESSADALIDLGEGNYVLLCFVEDADGVPHLALGMVQPFTVVPATGEVAAMPDADATVNMVDFGYGDDTTSLPASGVVEVVNTSDSQLHEMNMLRLSDGAAVSDAAAFFGGESAGPPPFASLGGMQALMPKGSSFLVLEDLAPGDYAFICLIPDPTDGVPHIAKGMAAPAAVS